MKKSCTEQGYYTEQTIRHSSSLTNPKLAWMYSSSYRPSRTALPCMALRPSIYVHVDGIVTMMSWFIKVLTWAHGELDQNTK